MQKIALFVMMAFIAYGCASSKKMADVSIGTWEYVIKDLPDGDATGTFTIAKEGDEYTGTMIGDQGTFDLEDLSIVDGEMTCNINYSGYEIYTKGTFEGTTFTGSISAEGYDFPMTAVKKE